jgi:hypothetical protein
MQGNTMAEIKKVDQSIVMYSIMLIGFAGSALAGVPAPPPRTGGAHPEHQKKLEDGRSVRRLGAVLEKLLDFPRASGCSRPLLAISGVEQFRRSDYSRFRRKHRGRIAVH